MNLRKVIDTRIRRRLRGVDVAGDVNAVVAANVNEPGSSVKVSSRQTAVSSQGRKHATREARMSEKETEKTELSEEELNGEEAEELPARETMMLLDLGPDVGLDPGPSPESEAPDDRYEQ